MNFDVHIRASKALVEAGIFFSPSMPDFEFWDEDDDQLSQFSFLSMQDAERGLDALRCAIGCELPPGACLSIPYPPDPVVELRIPRAPNAH